MSELYSFESEELKLIDSELGLNIEESFFPLLLPDPLLGSFDLPSGYNLKTISNDENQVVEAYFLKNDRMDGQYQLYYPSGKLKMNMYYQEGLLHGPVTFYQENGVILALSWFLRGKVQGKSKWYHKNNTLYSLQRFLDGIREGKQEYFYANGQKKTVQSFKNGLIDGDVFLFDEAGTLTRQYLYSNGKRVKQVI
jgi:antitoxin component YwqK of YwqJK toxin-antitoxin module